MTTQVNFLSWSRKAGRLLVLMAALAAPPIGTRDAGAKDLTEKILPLDGHIGKDGTVLELNWFDAKPPRVGSVTVKRRLYGQTGGRYWQTLAPSLGPVMRYTDTDVKPGTAYEYQVLRSARDIVDLGYWVAGTELPAVARRGSLYLIVDETIADAIAPRLARFERDLIGDGWDVRRHQVPRHAGDNPRENLEQAIALRAWLRERYTEDPFTAHAAILVGHVPIVKSGKANPDGHAPKAHGTDLFYADVDGRWTATVDGQVLDNRVPGDFIEMQISRIDFSAISWGKSQIEIRYLNAYFDKNHHWRRGLLGDLREAYGNSGHLDVELAGLRNIVGPSAITTGGHHDVGEEKPWLWGVDFGDWDGASYSEKYANKAVFAINFGSGKQQISHHSNQMVALLAQPWYTVAVGWGARPAWWLHHMALGGSIGDVHMHTVNNGRAEEPYRSSMDYFPTGRYLWRNPVWVNLLGDPSLRAFPLRPAEGLTAARTATGVQLEWDDPTDRDVRGYRVFRIDPEGGAVIDLNADALATETSFLDTAAPPGQPLYMVRAYGLKSVYAGSFYTYAQGTFAKTDTADQAEEFAPDIEISAPMTQAVVLPAVFNTQQDGKIHALIEGPPHGQLRLEGSSWIYTPRAGFAGVVPLRFSVSDQWRTEEAELRITITRPSPTEAADQ